MCVQESHWHVQNVNNVTTIQLRIRKLILNVWKQKNTASSVNHTHYTKKQNNLCKRGGIMTETTEKKAKKSVFKALKGEFKKIIWPNKQSLAKQTVAVISVSVMLGLLIAVMDYIIQYGVDFLVGLSF